MRGIFLFCFVPKSDFVDRKSSLNFIMKCDWREGSGYVFEALPRKAVMQRVERSNKKCTVESLFLCVWMEDTF
jgi:hypothetical protein